MSIWPKANEFVASIADDLRRKDYSEISVLPECTELDAPEELDKLQCYVWRKNLGSGLVRVRVEAFRNYFGGIYTRSEWSGFDISPSGAVTEIEEGDFR